MKIDGFDNSYFINQITQRTEISTQRVVQETKYHHSYPADDKYEKGLAEGLSNFGKATLLADSKIEKKPVADLQEMMNVVDEAKKEAGLTGEQEEVLNKFYHTIRCSHGDQIDDNKVLPTGVEDLGYGVLMVEFSKNLLFQEIEQASLTPDGKVKDYVENKPSAVLFVDTTPGKKGMCTFYTQLE